MVDLQSVAGGGGDGLQVAGVGADDQVVAAHCSLDHAGIDDIGGSGACGERTDRARLPVIHGLDVAAGQQPDELGLAGYLEGRIPTPVTATITYTYGLTLPCRARPQRASASSR